jgi:predicted transcriptional regulator
VDKTGKKTKIYLSKEEAAEKAKQFGFILTEEFKTLKTPVEGVCLNGHKRKARLGRVFAGDKCKKCIALEKGKITNNPQEVLDLHEKGLTPHEIAKQLGNLTANAVRNFLKKEKKEIHKKPLKDQSRECHTCKAVFVPKTRKSSTSDKVFCSKKCLSEHMPHRQAKYNNQDVEKIIELKKLKKTNLKIKEITGVSLSSIKKIIKQNNLFLSKEEAQKNAYKANIDRDPEFLNKMRKAYLDKITSPQAIAKLKEDLKNKNYEYVDGFIKKHSPFRVKCNSCNKIKEVSNYFTIKKNCCKSCSGTGTSSIENEISDWIELVLKQSQSNHHIVQKNNRSIIPPKELDIYIPELNLAIEYCGLYWHSEPYKDKNYHYNKMKECNNLGIRLITIFEDEWKNRAFQIKNLLKSVLGVYTKRVFARKCQVKEISTPIAKIFLEKNHIQGSSVAEVAFGLYFDSDLLGVVTASKHHRQGQEKVFVLNRLAFLDNIQVIGGTSKLLRYLVDYSKEKGYKKLISWSDSRWSEGNVYKKTGFKLEQEIKPDYSYFCQNTGKRLSKQSNTKKALLKKGAIGKTEHEMALSLDLYRIWDCGKKRWVINF